jgi:GTPase SAR1 family protein
MADGLGSRLAQTGRVRPGGGETQECMSAFLETLQIEHMEMICWDVGGCDKNRSVWRQYTANTNAVVFVVDSNDKERSTAAKEELQRLTGGGPGPGANGGSGAGAGAGG